MRMSPFHMGGVVGGVDFDAAPLLVVVDGAVRLGSKCGSNAARSGGRVATKPKRPCDQWIMSSEEVLKAALKPAVASSMPPASPKSAISSINPA